MPEPRNLSERKIGKGRKREARKETFTSNFSLVIFFVILFHGSGAHGIINFEVEVSYGAVTLSKMRNLLFAPKAPLLCREVHSARSMVTKPGVHIQILFGGMSACFGATKFFGPTEPIWAGRTHWEL